MRLLHEHLKRLDEQAVSYTVGFLYRDQDAAIDNCNVMYHDETCIAVIPAGKSDLSVLMFVALDAVQSVVVSETE